MKLSAKNHLVAGLLVLGARKKQLALVDLSFLKHRQQRGDSSKALRDKAEALRATIAQMNQNGVSIGKSQA